MAGDALVTNNKVSHFEEGAFLPPRPPVLSHPKYLNLRA
jgi:hypothetical protein